MQSSQELNNSHRNTLKIYLGALPRTNETYSKVLDHCFEKQDYALLLKTLCNCPDFSLALLSTIQFLCANTQAFKIEFDSKRNDKKSALDFAIDRGHEHIIEHLLQSIPSIYTPAAGCRIIKQYPDTWKKYILLSRIYFTSLYQQYNDLKAQLSKSQENLQQLTCDYEESSKQSTQKITDAIESFYNPPLNGLNMELLSKKAEHILETLQQVLCYSSDQVNKFDELQTKFDTQLLEYSRYADALKAIQQNHNDPIMQYGYNQVVRDSNAVTKTKELIKNNTAFVVSQAQQWCKEYAFIQAQLEQDQIEISLEISTKKTKSNSPIVSLECTDHTSAEAMDVQENLFLKNSLVKKDHNLVTLTPEPQEEMKLDPPLKTTASSTKQNPNVFFQQHPSPAKLEKTNQKIINTENTFIAQQNVEEKEMINLALKRILHDLNDLQHRSSPIKFKQIAPLMTELQKIIGLTVTQTKKGILIKNNITQETAGMHRLHAQDDRGVNKTFIKNLTTIVKNSSDTPTHTP